ncbi:hypothetical protein [Vibrio splendidus]|uniref:hypothetical protein n=1 Tax=Vibrio splendidus TaxID=29497 RepID=UPI001249C2C1
MTLNNFHEAQYLTLAQMKDHLRLAALSASDQEISGLLLATRLVDTMINQNTLITKIERAPQLVDATYPQAPRPREHEMIAITELYNEWACRVPYLPNSKQDCVTLFFSMNHVQAMNFAPKCCFEDVRRALEYFIALQEQA